ncbi:hypothetical protein Bca52824_054812 [Brassica carinata]|uniref:Uncharacterized protein n=1 Tax=Brassica carinata TaxID=52824 RepID=A0A8X7UM07_BRACI|nr:hypothetical protein Bca52824_054812 [Brassica carinata]
MACCMAGVHASRHTGLCVSIRMRRSQVLRHLELRLVKLHVQQPCTSRPPPFDDTQLLIC